MNLKERQPIAPVTAFVCSCNYLQAHGVNGAALVGGSRRGADGLANLS